MTALFILREGALTHRRRPHDPVWYRHCWNRTSRGNWHPLPREGAADMAAKLALSGPAPHIEVQLANGQVVRVKRKVQTVQRAQVSARGFVG